MSGATLTVLEQIRARRGQLTPRIVVDESRPEDAPLHSRFEWDDSVAGERFREVQAANILRVHVQVIPEGDLDPFEVRAYLPVRDSEGVSSYMPTEQIAQSPQQLAIVQQMMNNEWRRLRRKYQHHQEFFTMVLADIETEATG